MQQNWKKDIVLFLTSQTMSLFGSSLVQYAIMWYITLKTQSGIMMTIFIICGFVPTFFLSPFAGVWADRYNRKVIIILSDTIIATVTLIMAIVFIMGYKEFWLLASPIASGALLTMASIELIFFIDVFTAAVGVLTLLFFLRVPPHAKALEKQKVSYYTDLREGFHYIKNHAYVRKFFIFCGLFFILVSPVAFLTPLQVARSFGNDVWRLTMIEITFSAGMIIGGIIMASWGGFRNKIHTMVMACLIMGAGTVALGIIPMFWLYNVIMAVVGLAMPMMNTPSTVLLQQKVEEEFLGRVFGVLSMISSSMMPLGMLIFGPLSDYFKIEWMLIGTGVLMIMETILLLGNKVLIEIGRS